MPKKRANGEGSIRKRKDGRWEGRYTAGNDPTTGKPIHKSVLAKTQSEDKEKLRQVYKKMGLNTGRGITTKELEQYAEIENSRNREARMIKILKHK